MTDSWCREALQNIGRHQCSRTRFRTRIRQWQWSFI